MLVNIFFPNFNTNCANPQAIRQCKNSGEKFDPVGKAQQHYIWHTNIY